jgi:alkanesulfonate monooxygenase SsuD/methylene tetrahydromethanopterin reductase-like flavin-dependent oxidoreductase (luciferase family)
MPCPRCGNESPPRAKFCAECGSPLQRACARCGTPLPPAARFCHQCAQPTDTTPDQTVAAPEAYTPPLTLGVSLGGRPEEYMGLGVPMERRVAVFRESVTVLRRLLAGEPVSHRGAFFRLENATIRPAAPARLYFGGQAEGALRRAGELADGWIMGPFGTIRDFPAAWRVVTSAASAAGRAADALVAGRLVYVAVDEDRDRARDTLRVFLHGYYGPRFDVDQSAIFGPPRDVAGQLSEHVSAGISQLMLGVPTLDLAHLRRVATEVAPLVRAASRR